MAWCFRSLNRAVRVLAADAFDRIGVVPMGSERLAAVPHDGGEEPEVRRRKGAAEERELGGAREAVGVVDVARARTPHPDGMGRPIRITPLLSSMLNACCRAATVETSAFGEFEPSTVRKMGSSPRVCRNRVRNSAGVIVQADDATWQDAQDLPFVPRLWKNGFERSSGFTVQRDRAEHAGRILRVEYGLLVAGPAVRRRARVTKATATRTQQSGRR